MRAAPGSVRLAGESGGLGARRLGAPLSIACLCDTAVVGQYPNFVVALSLPVFMTPCTPRPALRWLLLLPLLLAAPALTYAQNVGIGTATPDASAALEVQSTSGGVLFPRLTNAQRAAIASPAPGLFVFQTDGTPGLYYYYGGVWVNVGTGRIPDAVGYAGPSPTAAVSTLAGAGAQGFADGPGATAQFHLGYPSGVAADGSGNVYVADVGNQRIRRIVVATGAVSTLAGSGTAGFADGPGTTAQFNNPIGVAADNSGNVFVTDQNNYRIRRIVVATGVVSTLAGAGTPGLVDGTGPAAQFATPSGVAVDGSGNVFVADQSSSRIRRIVVATGVVSTLAGTAGSGYADGAATVAKFANPTGVAVDGSGNLYVADTGNNRIRKVVATGAVSTLAGSGGVGTVEGPAATVSFTNALGVAADASGNVFVVDGGSRIRQIAVATGVVSTLAGTGATGYADGPVGKAQFTTPVGVAVDGGGTVYVTDLDNQRVRLIK